MVLFIGSDKAVDLGTANSLVYVRGRGIVLNEPSVVAINTKTGAILAVGSEAKRMIGRTPASITAIRPLRHGVIADFEVTEQMLRHFMERVHSSRHARPRVMMCVPSGITDVEQRARGRCPCRFAANRTGQAQLPLQPRAADLPHAA